MRPRRSADLALDAAAVVAALLVLAGVAAPIPSTAARVAMVATAVVLVTFGWLATMWDLRRVRAASAAEVRRVVEEKAELERLLDASINSQRGQGVEPDLKRKLEDLARTLGADAAACFLIDDALGLLRPLGGAYGLGPGSLGEHRLTDRQDDPLGQVIASGTPFRKSSTSASPAPRLLPKGYGAGAVLVAPMLVENEVMGVMVVSAPDRAEFSDKDVELALATASGCGVALRNAQLLSAAQQQLKRSTVIKDVAMAVNSTLELGHILHLFLGKARGIVEYDRAAVVLFEGQEYRIATLVDAEGELRRAGGTVGGVIAGSPYEAVREGRLSVRSHLGASDVFATEAPAQERLGEVYSEALVPLRSKGEVAGAVAFRTAQGEGFPAAIHPTLYELANLGGMAIANSMTHYDAATQARHLDLLLGSLSEVSRVLTATTEGPEALERRVVETAARLFDGQVAVLTRVDEGGHHVVAAFDAGGVKTIARQRMPVVPGAGLIGAVTLQQGTVRSSRSADHDLLTPLRDVAGVVSAGVAAPMFLDGTFRGALAVFGAHPYDESETAVLTTVANQVAVALRNAELFDRSQRSVWELSNLHEGLKAIASSLDMQQVLDSILGRAAAVAGAQIGSIMLLEEGRLQIRALHGTDVPTSRALSFGIGEGIAGKVVQTGQPILANDVSQHPDFQTPTPERLMPKALLCVPMRLGDEVIGVINLSNYQRTDVFDSEAVRVVNSLATQTSIAVQNARLYQHLRNERDRLISLEEVLRQDLARDLHDGPVQRLAGMAMNIEVIRQLMRPDPDRAAAELTELDKLVRLTIKEARTMLFELRPLVLETQGLAAALESYAEQYEANTGLEVDLDLPDSPERLAPAVEQTMFSVMQEALGNVKKHARATHVRVSLGVRDDTAFGRVADDGVGFDVAETQATYAERASQSLGLVNMVERAERVGGNVEVDSAPGRGTTVTITVPRGLLAVRTGEASAG